MKSFSERLTAHLESIGWGPYDIWKWFKPLPKEQRLSEQYIYALCRGDKPPKDDATIRKLASVEGLGLTYEQLKAWKVLDENDPEVLYIASRLQELEAEVGIEKLKDLHKEAKVLRQKK